MNNQNSYSYLTAINRESLSYPARILLERKLLCGSILDFGCGYGKDVELLKGKGFNIEGFDPYYSNIQIRQKYDTIICFYVLNVLLIEEQANVLMDVSYNLKPGGKAYFAVRRDIQYEGFRMHKIHKKPTYQCLVKLPFKSIYKNENVEIYEYQHYNLLANDSSSPFINNANEIIVESASAFSIYDKYPVNKGHALVIPKREVSNYFDLTFKEQSACWFMVNKVKQIIENKYHPDGFNIGVNINKAAGQTINHVHIHIIPRNNDDVNDPTGGIRNVIPSKGNYLL